MKRFLLIDTAREPATVAIATSRQVLAETQVAERHQLSERLLGRIDELTEAAAVPLSKITAIGIVSGPGPFTALRVGVAVTNALAYAHGKSIVGVTVDEAPSILAFAALVAQRQAAGKTAEAILPDYGREPTITPPKRRVKVDAVKSSRARHTP